MVRMPVSRDDLTYLGIEPKKLRAAIATHLSTDPMPVEYDMNTRTIYVGSIDAIEYTEAV